MCNGGQVRESEDDCRSCTKNVVWKPRGLGTSINHSYSPYLAALQKGTSEHHHTGVTVYLFAKKASTLTLQGYPEHLGARTGRGDVLLIQNRFSFHKSRKAIAQSF